MRRASIPIALVLALAPASLHAAPRALAPALSPQGRVVWSAFVPAAAPDSARLDSIAAHDPALRPLLLRRLAERARTDHEAARADSLWSELARAFPLWAPMALRARVDLALSRLDRVRAESLLAVADLETWSDPERADLLARHAALRLEVGDPAQAIPLARETMERYPATAAAPRALQTLEQARGSARALTAAEVRAAAEVEALHGQRLPAAQRLERLFASTRDPERWRLALRAAEMLRADRRYDAAVVQLEHARAVAPGSAARARVTLEQARVKRDAGESDRALASFAVAASTGDSTVRAAAHWERARELESRGAWPEALAAYAAVARRGSGHESAAFRAGVVALAWGAPDSALDWLEGLDDEAARWMRAGLLRTRALMLADTTLRGLALTPGYSFQRDAAREALGLPGWPRAVAAADSARGTLALARALLDQGREDDALGLLERWAAGDLRLQAPLGPGPAITPGALLAAATLAHRAGRIASGVRLAQQALDLCPPEAMTLRWGIAPWLYPPAFEAEVAAAGVDPALLHAVMWQESKFDPAARSRSNALGLFQLKAQAATDVARWLGEKPPGEAGLLDPARSVRFGARYLQHLIERFGNDTLLAVAAYNAGPGTIERWEKIRTWRDPALDVELIARPETEDYVKRVLSVRQAYRELAPAVR